MENDIHQGCAQENSSELVPSLIKYISSNDVAGFDDASSASFNINDHSTESQSLTSTPSPSTVDETDEPMYHHKRVESISISMPTSPVGVPLHTPRRVIFSGETIIKREIPDDSRLSKTEPLKPPKHHFRPIMLRSGAACHDKSINDGQISGNHQNVRRLKDKRYDSFKTWSGRLERQITLLRGKPTLDSRPEDDDTVQSSTRSEVERNFPVDRYFDALEGPELETLKASEEMVLPHDKIWPFLLRYPISSFGICLGVSSQAIMWKALATTSSTKFLHISLTVNLVLWCISIALIAIVTSIYFLKVILYFEAVRREYYHPIRINFFFAPWISLLFLALGVPPLVAHNLPSALWYVLMAPIFCLELKIYGQWMSGGQRRLSKVANPSNHLSVVGNFVGALLGASMGLKEGPIFFFAIGLAHYTVLFVTLYQRLPTNDTLPKELHPVFFLFVAAPSVASMAWAKIQGTFDCGSRIAYFIALFLYFSLAVRLNFFRGFKFSMAWWAYTFPMTGAAIATIRYSNEVKNVLTQALAVILCSASTLTVTSLLITTILHAFVLRDLFPNDIAIAISDKRPKTMRKWFLRHSSSDSRDVENFLKFSCSNSNDLEASLKCSSSQRRES